ncbi:MAG: RNase adapter RapZ [Deltaproteobacteria bacterium]|nr:MAG: RNase adapter RapZ [Deltaproteobacteria bacterium]
MTSEGRKKAKKNEWVVVVTGLSGSGKSTAIKAFEDLDFFCVDNLPVLLLPDFLNLREESSGELWHIALGMDIRERRFLDSYPKIFNELWNRGIELEILFLDATDDTLQRRFSQTRRKHPMAGTGTVLDGIRAERERLKDLKRMATRVLDTSNTNVHELKRMINSLYAVFPDQETLHIHVLSFGFKYGVPTQADVVMDVRFLPNPFFLDHLRNLDGTNEPVIDFVLKQEQTKLFLEKFTDLVSYLLPRYREEGKSYLTIAIGCTGGRHRSVVISEQLRERLAGEGYTVTTDHRDVAVA